MEQSILSDDRGHSQQKNKCYYSDYLDYFNAVLEYLKDKNFKNLRIKLQPSIYYKSNTNKLELIAQRNQIKISECSVGAIIHQWNYNFPTKRKLNIKSSHNQKYTFSTAAHLSEYWPLVEECYPKKFGYNAVHSFEEIKNLTTIFKNNISIVSINDEISSKIIAGLMIFEDEHIAKIQYIAYLDEALELSLINLLYYETLKHYTSNKKSIDWGSSMDIVNGEVKASILWLKEKFGASPTAINTVIFNLNQLKM